MDDWVLYWGHIHSFHLSFHLWLCLVDWEFVFGSRFEKEAKNAFLTQNAVYKKRGG